LEELLQFEWGFRFKDHRAGFSRHDPWWQGKKPARVKFYSDGNILFRRERERGEGEREKEKVEGVKRKEER
jgi:hypothetical protein